MGFPLALFLGSPFFPFLSYLVIFNTLAQLWKIGFYPKDMTKSERGEQWYFSKDVCW